MNSIQETQASIASTGASPAEGGMERGLKSSNEHIIGSTAGDPGRLKDALEAWEEMGALSKDVGAFLIETQSYALKDTLSMQRENSRKRDLDASRHSEKDPKIQKPTSIALPNNEDVKHQVNRINKMTLLLTTLESTHKELRNEVQSMLHESQSSLQLDEDVVAP